MGEGEAEKTWFRDIEEYLYMEFGEDLEAILIFGSYARGDYKEYSDVDVAIISDRFRGLHPFDRVVMEFLGGKRVEIFRYSYDEIRRMYEKANSLALSILIDGLPLKISPRLKKLSTQAKKKYVRIGKGWMPAE